MKKIFIVLIINLLCHYLFGQNIEMPVAKFFIGDYNEWRNPSFDDSHWPTIRPTTNWELQGYPDYNGYAWYRFHVTLPSSLKNNSYLKDSLRIFLAKIDDCHETYLNGMLIAKSGSFPTEKDGYITTWNKLQEIHISVKHPALKWDAENIIAIKVYDGGGGGGLFFSTPYINLMDLIDNVVINNNTAASFGSNIIKQVTLTNRSFMPVSGKFSYQISTDNVIDSPLVKEIKLGAKKSYLFTIVFPLNKRHQIIYTFEETYTHKKKTVTEILPYILTPPVADKPKINGPKVFGVKPGSPVLYKIPATGKAPLQYSAENLPEGLIVNPLTGIITGTLQTKADYKIILSVKNKIGVDKKEFTIKCGGLIALTPPMGWNSWNCWGLSVSDEKVKSSAQAMLDKGLAAHGWSYINIDDGWEAATRKSNGEIFANQKFPDMKKLGGWLHSNGLKFGIYSSPGTKTCGGFLGSYQHEEQDAATYANWGIDYLKYDWCSYNDVYQKEKDTTIAAYKKPYIIMSAALQKQNRDIVYSLCQYGMKEVWQWGAEVNGNCWRTTGDIEDTWESLSGIGFNQTKQYPYARPGRWNDPDMMIVGQVGWGENLHPTRLTPDEQYTHVSLWCMLNAPLLIGCDISKLDAFTLNLLTNDEVLAINQDVSGKQAQQVLRNQNYQVWIKDLEDGTKAIAIFNMQNETDVIRFYWNNLGLDVDYKVRDLWRQKDLGKFSTMFATKVAPHGVTLIKIEKTK